MKKAKAWLSAARLRTLPLSLSGIITGTALANLDGVSNGFIFTLCLLITIGFQITSNFANDYGDGIKGTDADDRVGPTRAFQSGSLSAKELKKGIAIASIISLLISFYLVWLVFGVNQIVKLTLFMILGILSIWAAIRYTVGKSAYGYRGLGDLFVFLFFGLLAVLGTKFIYANEITVLDAFPAAAIGLLCVGVLNLNNLRDLESDKVHGKNTLVVKWGFKRGKMYHYIILVLSFVFFSSFAFQSFEKWQHFLFLLIYVFVFMHLIRVKHIKNPAELDPELKKLALSTFALSLVFYFTINYFL